MMTLLGGIKKFAAIGVVASIVAMLFFVAIAPQGVSAAPINDSERDKLCGSEKVNDQVTCAIAGGKTKAEGNNETGCSGGQLGWLLCPITGMIQSATDAFFNGIMKPLLDVEPLSTWSNEGLLAAWDAVRNLANVAFIIAFLIIIFSQATSYGLSSYGIKRLLPKLVLVAILTNISFYVCAFMVDVFNLLGDGVSNLMGVAFSDLLQGQETYSNSSFAVVLAAAVVTILGIIIASGGTLLGPLLSVIIVGFLAVLAALGALVFRQALIILLIVFSPLAFVAWLLPNTEKWFDKWLSTFWKLLFMYPLMAALFASGAVLGRMMNQILGENVPNGIAGAAALLAYTIPLFVIPFTFKFAGGAMTAGFNALNSRARGIGKSVGGAVQKPLAQRGGQRWKERGFKLGSGRLGENFAQSKHRPLRALGRAGGFASKITPSIAKRALTGETKFTEAERARQLERARQVNIAEIAAATEDTTATDKQKSAAKRLQTQGAGIGGQKAEEKVVASALKTLDGVRSEEVENAKATIKHAMEEGAFTEKEMSTALAASLSGSGLRDGGTPAENRALAYISQLDKTSSVFEKVLDTAAASGETAIAEARSSAQLDDAESQKMVDRVIARNKGTLMSKGYYPLTTQSDLAIGRMPGNSEAVGKAVSQALVENLGNSSAQDIAGMKFGLVGKIARDIEKGIVPARPEDTKQIVTTIESMLNDSNMEGQISEKRENLEKIFKGLSGREAPPIPSSRGSSGDGQSNEGSFNIPRDHSQKPPPPPPPPPGEDAGYI